MEMLSHSNTLKILQNNNLPNTTFAAISDRSMVSHFSSTTMTAIAKNLVFALTLFVVVSPIARDYLTLGGPGADATDQLIVLPRYCDESDNGHRLSAK